MVMLPDYAISNGIRHVSNGVNSVNSDRSAESLKRG